ncbi:MAG: putative transposase [Bradyrhizobium sp.]|nr:putative transposase [Bradyrhizobium sp.]MEA2954489.1 putative transposase [Alphaproteobacteria bacterium]
MISEVYDALISAGAAEDTARKAAETLADTDNRFTRIVGAVLKLESKLDGAVLKLEAELVLVKWMVGFAIALNVAILTRSFFH